MLKNWIGISGVYDLGSCIQIAINVDTIRYITGARKITPRAIVWFSEEHSIQTDGSIQDLLEAIELSRRNENDGM